MTCQPASKSAAHGNRLTQESQVKMGTLTSTTAQHHCRSSSSSCVDEAFNRQQHIPLLLVLVTLGTLSAEFALGQDTRFQFHQFSQNRSSLSLLGEASVAQDDLALELTRNATGRALYVDPIQFKDPTTQAVVSFASTFIFSIEKGAVPLVPNVNSAEGFAFLIAPDNVTLGSGGAWMGLMSPSNDTGSSAAPDASAKLVAVEFDVQKDVEFWDISNNHVGVDVNTLNSVFAKDAASGSQKVSLLSGHIKVWIEYDGEGRKLQVSMTPYAANNDYPKPADPLLALDLDLSEVVNEYMYVGFSAATRSGTVQHKIWSWTFESAAGGGGSGSGGFGYGDFAPSPAPSIPSLPTNGASRSTFVPCKLFTTCAFLMMSFVVILLLSS